MTERNHGAFAARLLIFVDERSGMGPERMVSSEARSAERASICFVSLSCCGFGVGSRSCVTVLGFGFGPRALGLWVWFLFSFSFQLRS